MVHIENWVENRIPKKYIEIQWDRSTNWLPELLPETRTAKPETRNDALRKTRPDPLPEHSNPTRPETRKSPTRCSPTDYQQVLTNHILS